MIVLSGLILLALLQSQPMDLERDGVPPDSGPTESLDVAKKPDITTVGPHQYEIGRVQIHAVKREIRFPARINMNEGLIEVVIASEIGKLHESILVTSIQPIHLHLALLLLGLRAGRNPGWYEPPDPALRLPGWDRPPGDAVNVFLTWHAPEGQREVRAETMLKDIRTGKCLPSTHWIFVGSSVDVRGTYAADESGSIMTNYHDRLAVLDNPLETGRVDDFTHANAGVIPALGTRVEVRIVPVSVATGGKPDAE